nr:uncharacterized protein LOC114260228 [Ipomoea batatas]GMD45577.1 uncharacterized protein LOC114260228 [Ipomoea batatas]
MYPDFVPVNCKQHTNIAKQCFAGYMPSDLYNLNSDYGSVDDLKHCIEEMHNQNLLVYVFYVSGYNSSRITGLPEEFYGAKLVGSQSNRR